jgi:hypothetical protein
VHHAGISATLEAVFDPKWLSGALDDVDACKRIIAIEVVDSSKTLAEKVRFRLKIEGPSGLRRTNSYCVKAHLDGSPAVDLLSEAHFYRDRTPLFDLRTPRAYYTAIDADAEQAIIIMDDVVDLGGRFLNAHTPYSLDTTRDSLAQLARLHASTWGNVRSADLDWISPRVHQMGEFFPNESSPTAPQRRTRTQRSRRAPERRQCARGAPTKGRPRHHVRHPR